MIKQKKNINSFYLILKRLFDIIFSILSLLIFFPALLVFSLFIKLSSAGPVLYKQIRIGKGQKPFFAYKFRTTSLLANYDNIDEIANNIDSQKIKITPIGIYLRKYSLDEIPLYINILKGDMSLIGPRPILIHEFENYKEEFKYRFDIKPGLASPISLLKSNEMNFENMINIEKDYCLNQSIKYDLKILLLTIPNALFGRG